MNRTDKEILIAARKRIEKLENWFQGEFESTDGGAICATQSLIKEGSGVGSSVYRRLRLAMGLMPHGQVCDYNDTHTHAGVLAAFDKAIQEA